AKLYSPSSRGTASFSKSLFSRPLTSPRTTTVAATILFPFAKEFLNQAVFQSGALLHNDLALHPWMDRAGITVCACLGKRVTEILVRTQRFRFETLVVTDHVVRDVVMVRPTNRASHRHRYCNG